MLRREFFVVIKRIFYIFVPPKSPQLEFVTNLAPNTTLPNRSSNVGYETMEELIREFNLVYGVPKYRTSKPKKQTRKFSATWIIRPTENIIACKDCGTARIITTMCLSCYEVIRQKTNEIKRRMMQYNPYLGERQKPQPKYVETNRTEQT